MSPIPTVPSLRRLLALALSTAAATAFAAGTPAPVKPPVPKPPASAPAPLPVINPGIARYLAIDIRSPANYARPVLPVHYDAQVMKWQNTPHDNPVTDTGATLGRVLFWDKRLSVDNAVSCASCHQQGSSFGTTAQFSRGIHGQVGTAHAPGLANLVFYHGSAMFWDKRAPSAEAQATQPIVNPIEMGYDQANGGLPALLAKMQSLPYYPELFTAVYGDPAITEERIQRALAQFERSMIATQSRWDQGYAKVYNPALADKGLGLDVPGLTKQENAGRALFIGGPNGGGLGCAGCHQPPTFALAPNALSNGLDAGETRIFKAPSLKSLAPGQPMMHDGRFRTLEQVVAHYSLGVQNGPALDNRLKNRGGDVRVPNLSPADAAALVAFLKTLNDPAFQADGRFGNPFRK